MRVAIVGCGRVAAVHLQALAPLPDVEVVAACDLDRARAEETAREHGIPHAYKSLADLLEGARPDVVHVLTPPATHAALTIQALEAGSHVLVEKPMALAAAEADEMIGVARRYGRVLGVCHNFLFAAAVLEARELVASGRLGTVIAAEIFWRVWRGPEDRYAQAVWMRELPGGFFHESAPHLVYLLEEFLGPLRVASALAKDVRERPVPTGELRAVFEGESGIGTAHVSLNANPYQIAIRVYGSELTAHLDILNEVVVTARDAKTLPIPDLSGARPRWRRPHETLLERFYESLRDGRSPPVTGEDGRTVVAVLDDLWRVLANSRRSRV